MDRWLKKRKNTRAARERRNLQVKIKLDGHPYVILDGDGQVFKDEPWSITTTIIMDAINDKYPRLTDDRGRPVPSALKDRDTSRAVGVINSAVRTAMKVKAKEIELPLVVAKTLKSALEDWGCSVFWGSWKEIFLDYLESAIAEAGKAEIQDKKKE